MAETQPTKLSAAPQPPAAAAPLAGPPRWSEVWQLPVLLLGVVFLGVGVALMAVDRRGPDLKSLLDKAEAALQHGDFEAAHTALQAVRERHAQASEPLRARLELVSGDQYYLAQQAAGWHAPDKDRAAAQHYEQAVKLGLKLDAEHVERWARVLGNLNRVEQMIQVLEGLAPGESAVRLAVLRQFVESRRAAGGMTPETLDLALKRFDKEVAHETDPARRRQQEIWSTALRMESLLDGGGAPGVVEQLPVQILRLQSGGDADLAPLFVLLARAYQQVGDLGRARNYYLLTQAKAPADGPGSAELAARILVGLGQTALAAPPQAGQPEPARIALEHFTRAETDFRATSVYLDALLGRADCEARLGQHADATEHLRQVVKRLAEGKDRPVGREAELVALIRRQHGVLYERGEHGSALGYLELLAPLFKPEWPEDLLVRLAETYAAQALTQAADPANAAEAMGLYDHAGDLFMRHTKAVTINQVQAYGDSLWRAAECYRNARQWKKAIEALGQFAKSLPTDSRQQEAMLRLALAHMAAGQPSVASEFFKQLVEQHPQSPQAYAGLVPMARCYIALKQFDDAERVLRHVITDHPVIKPESQEYRQALTELGKLLYRQGQYEPAIEKLTEAVERYGSTREGPGLRYVLADTYRRSIAALDATLQQPQPATRKQALAEERVRRLEEAQQLYSQAVEELDAPGRQRLDELEQVQLRNAFFYRADCAYDLGSLDQAISLYDYAAKRFDSHPASLMALVQIVNAYCAQGKLQEARVANRRARDQLRKIPPEVFDQDRTLPLNRQHFDDWLRFVAQYNLMDVAEPQGPTTAAPTADRPQGVAKSPLREAGH